MMSVLLMVLGVLAGSAAGEDPARPPYTLDGLASGVAVLLDRSATEDYERCTFSFEHGVRDDPDGVVANAWDLALTSAQFSVSGGRTIHDLGTINLDDVRRLPPIEMQDASRAPAREGHSYLVRITDASGGRRAALFRVAEHQERQRCVIEWVTARAAGTRSPNALALDRQDAARLASLLSDGALRLDPGLVLREPRVRLQIRGGAHGGSASVRMTGDVSNRVDRKSVIPLETSVRATNDEPVEAFADTGFIPDGQEFRVRRIVWRAGGTGEGRDRGGARLRILDDVIFDFGPGQPVAEGVLERPFTLRRGDERHVVIEIDDPGVVDVTLEGEFIPIEEPRGDAGAARPST